MPFCHSLPLGSSAPPPLPASSTPLTIATIDFSIAGVRILRDAKAREGWKILAGPYALDERHLVRRVLADHRGQVVGIGETTAGLCIYKPRKGGRR